MINETRERFIRDIAERLDPARIVELHFFPSIRQGPIETGVAVIAATPIPDPMPNPAVATGEAGALLPEPELELEDAAAAATEPVTPDVGIPDEGTPERAEVFTATYVWTRKGPERGKWVVEVTAEAHAPLTTVETVVRGVQVRAGEAMDAYRMSADEVRAVLDATAGATAPSGAGEAAVAATAATGTAPIVAG